MRRPVVKEILAVLLVVAVLTGIAVIGRARWACSRETPEPCREPVELSTRQGVALWCGRDPKHLKTLLSDMQLEPCLPQVLSAVRGVLGPIHVDVSTEGGGCSATPTPGYLSGVTSLALGLPIDVNLAKVQDLEAIPGIGFTLARRIVELRDRTGPFASLDDLLKVKGLGPSKLKKVAKFLVAEKQPNL